MILSIFINYNVISQTNEIGVFLGGSLFHGDVGYNNAEYAILESKPVFGFLFKRNFNYHFSLNFSVNHGELYANDEVGFDFFSTQRNLHFKSKITELGLIAEFNFRPYMSRDPEYNYSPVVFFGITKFYFNPKGEYTDNNWYDLRPLGTEGQGSEIYPAR